MIKGRLWECSINGQHSVPTGELYAWLKRDGLFSPEMGDMLLKMQEAGEVSLSVGPRCLVYVSSVE